MATVVNSQFKPKKDKDSDIIFEFEDELNHPFSQKIKLFISSIEKYFKFLNNHDILIKSKNNFPHSSGIASSASAYSALALCFCSLHEQISGQALDMFFQTASHYARIGSKNFRVKICPTSLGDA